MFALLTREEDTDVADTKNLCAQIPIDLHRQVREHQEESGKSLGEYMTWLIYPTTSMMQTRSHWKTWMERGWCSMAKKKKKRAAPKPPTVQRPKEFLDLIAPGAIRFMRG